MSKLVRQLSKWWGLSTISRHPEPMVPQRGIDFGQGQEIDVPVARR